jgi:hypothetical protein
MCMCGSDVGVYMMESKMAELSGDKGSIKFGIVREVERCMSLSRAFGKFFRNSSMKLELSIVVDTLKSSYESDKNLR